MFRRRTLSVYIAKRFLGMIVGALVVCGSLIFMIDMIELLRQSRSAQSITIWQLMWVGFLRVHAIIEVLIPFAVLVGSIAALMSLSRKSELAVMRASGMSVWQFMRPGLVVALVFGIVSVVAYNPLAAMAAANAERLMTEFFGSSAGMLATTSGHWFRQDGVDGPSVMSAVVVADQGRTLAGVVAWRYDKGGRFSDYITADKAVLTDGAWEMTRVRIASPKSAVVQRDTYRLPTYLSPERALDALGTTNSVSVFDLPAVIETMEQGGVPAGRFRVQYETLISRPALLMAMVLLAATVSLRSFRQGGIQTMVVTGIVGGVRFFLLTEVSRQVGIAGLIPAAVAIWLPIVMACLGSATRLLNEEDG